ncbi:hypothetical protein D3C76_1641760 [compost metagenome]
MHDQFLQRATDRPQGQVAGHQVIPGHLQQRLGDTFEIPGQRAIENLLARQLRFLAEVSRAPAIAVPELTQDGLTGGIVLQQ